MLTGTNTHPARNLPPFDDRDVVCLCTIILAVYKMRKSVYTQPDNWLVTRIDNASFEIVTYPVLPRAFPL